MFFLHPATFVKSSNELLRYNYMLSNYDIDASQTVLNILSALRLKGIKNGHGGTNSCLS